MSKTFPICSALVSAAVILSGPAWADTLTWKSGGTDTNWSTPGNWTSKEGTHTVPQDGDTVVLSGTSANDLGSDAAPLQLAGLTASGSVTLTGNPLAFPTANSTISFSGGKFTCGVKIVGTATDGDFNIKGAADATFVANADIEAKSRIVLRLYGSSNVINGKITTPGKKILSYVNGGTCAYNGSLTCSTFATNNGPGGDDWGTVAEGTHVFGGAENAIADTAEAWRCNLKAAAPNAFKGAKIYLGYTQFEINANVYLQGNDQEIDRFTAPNPANAWSIKVDMRPNGTYGGGRISGGGTGGKVPRLAMKATGNCYYVGMIQDDLQLVWAPQGDYTFVVSDRSQKMTSPVIVSNGTFAVEGGTVVFPNVTGFKVAAGARLRVGTTNAMPFPSMTSLDLDENARLICKDAGASGLSTVKLNVRLAEGAKIAVEANKALVLKTLVKTAGDVPVGIGTYTGGEGSALARHADWIDGDGQVVVLSVPGMEIKTSTWKGGGANDNLSTPENWADEQAPSLQDGSARLELVESGSHVTVDQPALVNGIVDILGAEKSVTVDGEELQLLGGGIDSTNTVFSSNRSMVFDNDIALMAPQTWKPYGSLTFNGSIRSMSGKETLTINGPGVVNLTGTNTFAGPIIIDSGELRLSGEESLGDSSEPLTLNGKETRKPCLMLNGAHVKRPVSLANDHEYEFALRSKPGTVNVLAKPVTLGSTVNRMYLDERSTVVFEGGLTGWLFDPSSADDCSAWLIFRKTPLNETFLYMDGGGNVAFEVAGNKLSDNAFLCPWNGMKRLLVETRVENAFTTNCQIKMYGKTSAISANWDLCGFDQQCGRLVGGGGHFFVRSTKPASLTIYQTTITTNAVVFQGAASLVKEGAATLELSGASTSTGSVTVARGTLKFRTGSDWKHGQRRRFRNDFTVRAGAKLALESGVAITVRELYLPTGPDGALEKQETGTWGSSSSGATRKNDTYFAGEGVLNVIGTNVGMTVLIR